jgi:hypothetical protein
MKNKLTRPTLVTWLIFLATTFIFLACERKVTEPETPDKNMVTFRGRAFLAGQPAPVNQLHLPLHYDIEIISFLPGDSASYDTVYTDSSGVYTSTRLRRDGRYKILSRYPYYSTDTVQVEVKNGQVVGEMPRLFSQRLERIQIFADSLVYHSLRSDMFFTMYITNFSSTDTLPAPQDIKQLMIPKDDISTLLFASDPNITFSIELKPLQVQIRYRSRFLGNFGDDTRTKRPKTGTYYLYAAGQSWSGTGYYYQHYRKKIHWWFKVIEPSEIKVKLE